MHTFDVNQNSASGKAKQIRDMLKIHLLDHRWLLPSQLDAHPTIWLVSVARAIIHNHTCSSLGLLIPVLHTLRKVCKLSYLSLLEYNHAGHYFENGSRPQYP
jgi:hypothetical protein